ncbi:MAG: hypothetical protein MN733_22195 [Nitrososphaera sp.]|nr:hypothetical protein [Nitrososphaera sp.]
MRRVSPTLVRYKSRHIRRVETTKTFKPKLLLTMTLSLCITMLAGIIQAVFDTPTFANDVRFGAVASAKQRSMPLRELCIDATGQHVLGLSPSNLVVADVVSDKRPKFWTLEADRYSFIACWWDRYDIVVICDDGRIRRWSKKSNLLMEKKHRLNLNSTIAYSSNRKLLISASLFDKDVALVDLGATEVKQVISSPLKHPQAWLDQTGERVFIAGTKEVQEDPSNPITVEPDFICIHLKNQRITQLLHQHQGYIETFTMSPDGRWFATGCNLGWVNIFDSTSLKLLKSFRIDNCSVLSLAFTPTRRHLLVGLERLHPQGVTGSIELWSISQPKRLDVYQLRGEVPTTLMVTNSGRELIIGTSTGSLYILEVRWAAKSQ